MSFNKYFNKTTLIIQTTGTKINCSNQTQQKCNKQIWKEKIIRKKKVPIIDLVHNYMHTMSGYPCQNNIAQTVLSDQSRQKGQLESVPIAIFLSLIQAKIVRAPLWIATSIRQFQFSINGDQNRQLRLIIMTKASLTSELTNHGSHIQAWWCTERR